MSNVVIIGAGISGLSCAWRLKTLGIDSVVLEASDRAGGVIRTENIDGYQIEWGPNSFQPSATALRMVDELGLWDDLTAPPANSPRYIYRDGGLRKFPFGPLTFAGIGRVVREPFVRSKSGPDESVRDFFIRRFGSEAHDRLVAPLLTGIYAADTKQLSMAAVFPRMIEMEREYGSLVGAMFRSFTKKSKASVTDKPRPRGSIFTFPHGLEALPRRLAERVTVKYGVAGARAGDAPITVLTVPAYRAAEVLQERHTGLAALLKKVQYAPMVVAATSLPEDVFKEPLRGFGFLVPRDQGLHMLGTLFNSALFLDRAPAGRLLFTSFLGGAFEPDAVDWPEERIWDTVCSELQRALRTSIAPEPVALRRHQHAIPQYNIGHERWVQAVKSEVQNFPGLFVTSNYLEGISVPACMEQAERAAHAVAEYARKKS